MVGMVGMDSGDNGLGEPLVSESDDGPYPMDMEEEEKQIMEWVPRNTKMGTGSSSQTMCFEGTFHNKETVQQLIEIVRSLQYLAPSNDMCIVSLDVNSLCVVVKQDHTDGGIQAFATINPGNIFNHYIVESARGNEISVEVMTGGVYMASGWGERGEVRGTVAGETRGIVLGASFLPWHATLCAVINVAKCIYLHCLTRTIPSSDPDRPFYQRHAERAAVQNVYPKGEERCLLYHVFIDVIKLVRTLCM
jgi:hypothetical protein